MKFASPMGGIQQAGAPETAAKSVISCLYFRLVITSVESSLHFMITNFHTELKPQVKSAMAICHQHLRYTHRLNNNHGQDR